MSIFFITFIILILMLAYYGFVPTIAIVLHPLFILLALATSLAIGIWLSALSIKYRNFQYTLTFIIQLGLYASPIVYPSSMIPEQFRIFYGLNPMAHVIDRFPLAVRGAKPHEAMMLVSVVVVVVLLVGGLFYFKRMKQSFPEGV